MKTISINEVTYSLNFNWTLLQFTFRSNIDQIPRFCYHENLTIAGNCRMCLVEDSKVLKPVAACTIIVYNGMNIYTNSVRVRKAREGVLEFLLINHPLDCPICCQGGECDLQDLTEVFGGDKGRYYEDKRSVLDKNFGPFIKTIMNRCIHCTRCVRFAIEVSGITSLGVIGRGSKMEISSYIDRFFDSELSGNVVDLCPVGALTSKTYSFFGRPWELQSKVTINIFDVFIPQIIVDLRGNEILRILPRFDILSNTNEEWICDDIRYGFDGLKLQKLIYPVFILSLLSIKMSWRKVFFLIKEYFLNSLMWLFLNSYRNLNMRVYIGCLTDTKSIFLLKDILPKFGMPLVIHPVVVNYNTVSNYLGLNLDFDKSIQAVFLLGNNYRVTNPLINLKFREYFLKKKINFYYFGPFSNSNYFVKHIGGCMNNFINFFEGKNWFSLFLSVWTFRFFVSSVFSKIIKFNVVENVLFKLQALLNKTLKYNFIEDCISKISLSHFGLVNSKNYNNFVSSPFRIEYFLNVNEKNFRLVDSFKDLKIYQGHNMDYCGNFSNIILPSLSFFEDPNMCFLDIKGFFKNSIKVLDQRGFIKSDSIIIKALTKYIGIENYNLLEPVDLYIGIEKYGISLDNSSGRLIVSTDIVHIYLKSFFVNYFITAYFLKIFSSNNIISNSLNLRKHVSLTSINNWNIIN